MRTACSRELLSSGCEPSACLIGAGGGCGRGQTVSARAGAELASSPPSVVPPFPLGFQHHHPVTHLLLPPLPYPFPSLAMPTDLPYAADAEQSLSYQELDVLKRQYEKESASSHVTIQTKFNYAWGLVKCDNKTLQMEGVKLLQGKSATDLWGT